MWILPTRSRPSKVARFIDAWNKTGASTKLLLVVDFDDPALLEYQKLKLPETWSLYVMQERKPLAAIFNYAFAMHSKEDWYGCLADDTLPLTEGWDKELIRSAIPDKISYPDDLINGDMLSTVPVIGGDLVRELGWISLPGLDRLYGDTVLTALGRRRGVLRYRGDIKIEHLHFSTGKAEYDETYLKPNAAKDKQIFDAWLWSMDPAVRFVTVKWGTKYSADYVNILFDMIARNLPPEFGKKFICFTEDPTGIDEGIEIRSLPEGLTGWWNKLYLFKRGVCEEGTRIFYIDLDTAITGSLSEIASYSGEFAILRDFYRPDGLGSGLMLWRGGFGQGIWDSFIKAGTPAIDGGDQAWIEHCHPKADLLQDLFLGSIASYKERGQLAPPPGVKIVCFHGDPKPHELKDSWVEKVWKKGGGITEQISVGEISAKHLLDHVRHTLTLPLPNLQQSVDADASRRVCIVGGGASAHLAIEELRKRQAEGHEIWALDGALGWLAASQIQPTVHIMAGPKVENAELVPVETSAVLLYASQCHPEVFAKATKASKNVVVWHPMIDGIRGIIGERKAIFIGGGSTVGMLSISLAYALGTRHLHLYGFDSSYSAEALKAKSSNENAAFETISVKVEGESFTTTMRLAQQVNEFRMLLKNLIPQGLSVTLHGEGLLPHVMQQLMQAKMKERKKKADRFSGDTLSFEE